MLNEEFFYSIVALYSIVLSLRISVVCHRFLYLLLLTIISTVEIGSSFVIEYETKTFCLNVHSRVSNLKVLYDICCMILFKWFHCIKKIIIIFETRAWLLDNLSLLTLACHPNKTCVFYNYRQIIYSFRTMLYG